MLTPETRLLNYLGFRPTGDLGPLTGYTSKQAQLVWFLKAPPTCPPSPQQISLRNRFRMVAMAWKAMPAAAREQWRSAERRGGLNITGYNLFTWWSTVGDDATIRTIERQTDTNLIT